jgi:hypothetical protein
VLSEAGQRSFMEWAIPDLKVEALAAPQVFYPAGTFSWATLSCTVPPFPLFWAAAHT